MTCGRSVVFSLGTPVCSTNKTDRHDITEILLKVALITITLIPNPSLQIIGQKRTMTYGVGNPVLVLGILIIMYMVTKEFGLFYSKNS
jgi:hypothetical protein